jgi:hypothetical protein
LFAAEQSFLAAPFAAQLKTLLQQHIALRAFYPQVEASYRAIQTAQLHEPLPMDAVDQVVELVRANTPTLFDPSVSRTINETSNPEISRSVVGREAEGNAEAAISPPPDPLGEIEPSKAHDFQAASTVNQLWKVFRAGEQVHASTEGWLKTAQSMSGPVTRIVLWLAQFTGRFPS